PDRSGTKGPASLQGSGHDGSSRKPLPQPVDNSAPPQQTTRPPAAPIGLRRRTTQQRRGALAPFSHGPAVSSRRTSSNRRNAPALLRGSFLFPHLGDWMHEGQPLTHSQSAITSRVAVSHSRATL